MYKCILVLDFLAGISVKPKTDDFTQIALFSAQHLTAEDEAQISI